jgi:tetratricopeptide (TPR) repeat protein
LSKRRNTLTASRRDALLGEIRQAQEQLHSNPAEALAKLATISAEAAEAGIVSVHVLLGQAIASDYALDFWNAWKFITKAMTIDPLNPGVENSFGIIANRMRVAIAINPTDDATPKLYRLLLRASTCDETSHVAMAKYLDHSGKGEEALHLLDAVTTTAPASRDAWTMKAIIAKNLGKLDLAAEASAEALALGADSPVLFGSSDVQAAA